MIEYAVTERQQGNRSPGGRPLLRPAEFGALSLPNRVVMAPLTRARAATADRVPTDLHAAYYAQRASAGLIVAEGCWVSERAVGFPDVPGIHTERQARAWRRVTDTVHAVGGRIVVQLWHAGAVSHPALLGGERPAGPSAVDPGEVCRTPAGPRRTGTPREMTPGEVERTVADYAAAAHRAREAGFDGVEIAANGVHLLAQFLNPRLNRRRDRYGTRRERLLLEVTDAVAAVWGGGRVGVRLSPYWSAADRGAAGGRGAADRYPYAADADTLARYDRLVAELDRRPLAFLHLRGPAPLDGADPDPEAFARYRALCGLPLIANHGFGPTTGEAIVRAGLADAVSFGRHYIANPDLVSRLALGQPLAADAPAARYGGGPRGYADYPIAVPS